MKVSRLEQQATLRPPAIITLVDDVITRGSTFLAMHQRLAEALPAGGNPMFRHRADDERRRGRPHHEPGRRPDLVRRHEAPTAAVTPFSAHTIERTVVPLVVSGVGARRCKETIAMADTGPNTLKIAFQLDQGIPGRDDDLKNPMSRVLTSLMKDNSRLPTLHPILLDRRNPRRPLEVARRLRQIRWRPNPLLPGLQDRHRPRSWLAWRRTQVRPRVQVRSRLSREGPR